MIENTLQCNLSKRVFDRFFSIGGHIKGWEDGQTQNKVDMITICEQTVLELISSNVGYILSQISPYNSCINYLHVYLYLTLFF